MAGFGSTTFGTAAMQQVHNPNKDTELVQPPTDGITALHWSPAATGGNHLLVTSWDNYVRLYQIQASAAGIQSQPMMGMQHQAPVLCGAWTADGRQTVTGKMPD